MEVSAKLRFARITPRKARLVARLCTGMSIEKAHTQLRFCHRRASKMVLALLNSAVANAKEKGGIDIDNLFVKNVFVDGGPILKRFIPRAQGRATPILKKMSHITVVLDEAK